MHDAEQIFFLTPVEYAILLAGKGVKQHYTLQADVAKLDEVEICLAMGHLYQTGLIESDSASFFLEESLERLVNGIRDAEYILCIRFGRHEKRDFCCFAGKEQMTGLRFGRVDDNSYELFDMDETGIEEVLIKSLETRQVYEPVLEEEAGYQEIQNSRTSVSGEVIRRYHNLLLSVERISPQSGRVEKRFLIRFVKDGICLDAAWEQTEPEPGIPADRIREKTEPVKPEDGCDRERIRAYLAQMMERTER